MLSFFKPRYNRKKRSFYIYSLLFLSLFLGPQGCTTGPCADRLFLIFEHAQAVQDQDYTIRIQKINPGKTTVSCTFKVKIVDARTPYSEQELGCNVFFTAHNASQIDLNILPPHLPEQLHIDITQGTRLIFSKKIQPKYERIQSTNKTCKSYTEKIKI